VTKPHFKLIPTKHYFRNTMTPTPNFPENSTVLVTGANGHVAQHMLEQLLRIPSVKVRGTVRSATSEAALQAVFGNYVASGSLEIVQIPDITQEGAFDTALRDCTHVAHVASPLVVGSTNVEDEVLKPALRGTLSLLASAEKANKLKSVVVTGSFASVIDLMQDLRPGYIYTPKDWSPLTYELAADPALDLSKWPERYRPFVTYTTSKKVAERGAWDWWAEHKPAWDLSFVNPTYILGPYLLPVPRDKLSFSCQLASGVALSSPGDSLPLIDFPHWVDVRDVALAHLLAVTNPQARGERFILAPNKVPPSAFAKIAKERLGLHPSEEIQELPPMFDIDSRNCDSVLGMNDWITLEDSLVDLVNQISQN
jgi:nucleoside-diphosphate-sugar epimerase